MVTFARASGLQSVAGRQAREREPRGSKKKSWACWLEREFRIRREEVDDQQLLGVIKDINGHFTYDNLALFLDSLVRSREA